VILLGTLMAQFDLFVVNVAAPTLQAGLHTTTGVIQLAVGGYSLTYGTLLMTGGRLGDIFGPRTLLRVGMISLAVASGACTLCQTGPQLVAARLVQGACAALMVPQVLAWLPGCSRQLRGAGRRHGSGSHWAWVPFSGRRLVVSWSSTLPGTCPGG
jgi:MFS family permease